MTNPGKPLTFASMLVRAQRRFKAMVQALPATRQSPVARTWPASEAAAQDANPGLARWMATTHQGAVAG